MITWIITRPGIRSIYLFFHYGFNWKKEIKIAEETILHEFEAFIWLAENPDHQENLKTFCFYERQWVTNYHYLSEIYSFSRPHYLGPATSMKAYRQRNSIMDSNPSKVDSPFNTPVMLELIEEWFEKYNDSH